MLKIMKASAGSGKTYSLARTYISLLLKNEDRYAYRHILAVTFTNKATDEMKSRILKELHIMAVTPDKSSYKDDFIPSILPSLEHMQAKAQAVLHDILHDYSAFAVSTIDRFFQQTLKAFSREIGQFASYQVELDRDSLVAESVDRLLDSLTEDSGSLLSWLISNVVEQIEKGGKYSLDANLLNMAVRLKSSQRQVELEKAMIDEDQAYSKESLMKIRNACREVMTAFRDEVRVKARRALNVIEQAGVNPADSNRGFMKALYAFAELNDTDQIEAPTESFMNKAACSDQWFARAKAPKLLPLVYPFLEAPLEDFCALWDKEFAVYNTACILDGQIYGLGVAGELRQIYNQLMKEKNVLCIEDSNTILRDIIDGSDAPFVYEKLGVRYNHFLLDEFQDTSDVQWTNFSPLLHESESQHGENLIVGDVKQSIYRWRGSDWNLLDERIPAEFPTHEEDVLDTNYRSLSNVVDFNNEFFKYAAKLLDEMSPYPGEGRMEGIYSDVGQGIAKKDKENGSVRLTFCDKESELEQVLESVRESCEAGAMLSDIAVLVRSNASGEEVASYLIDNGIAVMTDDSLKVKNSLTVRRLVSLMSYVANPEDTVNSYLAESLDVPLPDEGLSLIDMAESLIRSIKAGDAEHVWEGEVLYIQSFMDYVQDYMTKNGNSLRGFLKYWEDQNPSISSPASGNCVRIMTIHKSKGLDFPYVIIPFVENITLYKPGNYWCAPALDQTVLSGVADGVYDVMLSGNSENTLFSEHYRKERFLQQVDNINTIYVAMTRAALGMHLIAKTPGAKINEFSQILYRFAQETGMDLTSENGVENFSMGSLPDFKAHRKTEATGKLFVRSSSDGYPSISLNGRLKYSADSVDFFSPDGQTGISASSRIKGIVCHDILSKVSVPEELGQAVRDAAARGEISHDQIEPVTEMLAERIAQVESRGWFNTPGAEILNEVSLIDDDGEVYRPDRVVKVGDKIMIVDYKFGEHHKNYEQQMEKYTEIWRGMGYEDVSAYLWYVHTGRVIGG